MHLGWCEIGLDPERFWNLTLGEISREFLAASRRRISEHNDRMHLAWHIAVLTRTKKFPRLNELFISDKPKKRTVQSWEQQLAIMTNWTSRNKN